SRQRRQDRRSRPREPPVRLPRRLQGTVRGGTSDSSFLVDVHSLRAQPESRLGARYEVALSGSAAERSARRPPRRRPAEHLRYRPRSLGPACANVTRTWRTSAVGPRHAVHLVRRNQAPESLQLQFPDRSSIDRRLRSGEYPLSDQDLTDASARAEP